MKFIADLHVHSKYSIATAKNLDLENLHVAAQMKGITVLGTGDFTHPKWLAEIREKLLPAEDGLFRLKDEIADECDKAVPAKCRGKVRFVLQCEISNIYKKDGRTRKNHNVIFVPDLDTAANFGAKLGAIGNIKSDGRPILGLDAKDLLEILLETSPKSFLIPAHIWTPWFSMFGSKSGFDTIEECYEDLAGEIFAAETGLSSDPPMNWRVSQLDRLTLVSNSDAHSPFTLGRNANVFDTELSYSSIRSALETGDPNQCLGTLDMYPEEGKYHMDGHRNCGVVLHPKESMEKDGKCPVCGRPLTLGVLYRVEELADRPEGEKPENAPPCFHIIPLPEVLSEIFGVGPKSKKVDRYYRTALETLGPELRILRDRSADEINGSGIPLLGEAVQRMRSANVRISPGHDGEYGTVKLFDPDEKEELMGQQKLFDMPRPAVKKRKKPASKKEATAKKLKKAKPAPVEVKKDGDILAGLNPEQREAVEHGGGALMIVAGPGAGKTRTLTHRIAHIIKTGVSGPDRILAVTFTNKAAREMKERLQLLLPDSGEPPLTATFHALCLMILKELNRDGESFSIVDDDARKTFVSEAARQAEARGTNIGLKANALSDMIASAKQKVLSPDDDLCTIADPEDVSAFRAVYEAYQSLLSRESLCDFEDLIMDVVKTFETTPEIAETYRNRFRHVFVDEYQDLNQGQYRLVKALSPDGAGLTVIGDPDQSIYGFRGSDVRFFQQFVDDYPESKTIRLSRNYRSTETILAASHQVIRDHSLNRDGARVWSDIDGKKTLTIFDPGTEKAEAVAVGKTIEKMIGGIGFHSVDFGKTDEAGVKTDRSFSDFAVMFRTAAQGELFAEVFESAGIPHQMANRNHACGRKGIAELISFLKIIEKTGTIDDLEKVAGLSGSGVGHKAFGLFKSWYFKTGFTLDRAMAEASRYPVPGMKSAAQRSFCAFIDRIGEFADKTGGMPATRKIEFLTENTTILPLIVGNPKTKTDYESLLGTAEARGNGISDFLDNIALQTDPDAYDAGAEKVALMTMHASKGLEFPVVFITGCEDGYVPFKRSEDVEPNVDEERRLFYVAMTRAKESLFLSHARTRMIYGKTVSREISPFVSDIEKRMLEIEKRAKSKKKAKDGAIQLSLFD